MLLAARIDGNHTVQRWTAISAEVAALPLHETPLRKPRAHTSESLPYGIPRAALVSHCLVRRHRANVITITIQRDGDAPIHAPQYR